MSTWKVIATALCILILILVAGYMQGCSKEDIGKNSQADPNSRFYSVDKQNKNVLDSSYYDIVDQETGVHYLVVHSSYGTGVCPMYNADGTLKTEEVKQ